MYPAAVKGLMVPGRDDPVWTNWLGEFLNLNGMQRCQYYIVTLPRNCHTH